MKLKRRLRLAENIYATLTVDVSMTEAQKLVAEANGMGREEQHNAMDQKMGELADLLGNTDEV